MLADQEIDEAAGATKGVLAQAMGFDPRKLESIAHRSPERPGVNLRSVARRTLGYRDLVAAIAEHQDDFPTMPFALLTELRTALERLVSALAFLNGINPEDEASLPQNLAQSLTLLKSLESQGPVAFHYALIHQRRHEPALEFRVWFEHVQKEIAGLVRQVDTSRMDAHVAKAAAEAALTAAQSTAAQVAITRQSAAFGEAMTENGREAIAWIIGSAVMAISLLLIVVWLLTPGQHVGPAYPHESWLIAGNLGYFAARALGVSVLSFALVVCVRNYRAARHNEIMNGHRLRALTTYTLLRESATGAAADAILLRAADAIFSVQASGYSDAAPPTTHVPEMAAAIGLSKKGRVIDESAAGPLRAHAGLSAP